MAGIFGIAGAIVTLAMLTVAVSHPATANIINGLTSGFVNAIKAAKA